MNNQIFFLLYNLAHQARVFDSIIVFFAIYFPYFVILIAGVFLLMHHEVFKAESTWQIFLEKKKEIFRAFFAGGLAWVLAKILKLFIHANRPFTEFTNVHPLFPETGYAFPSGHATFFMALAVSIFCFHKKAGYWFIFFALLIGLTRIIAGVHFPVDILGGFILGFLVAYSVKKI